MLKQTKARHTIGMSYTLGNYCCNWGKCFI